MVKNEDDRRLTSGLDKRVDPLVQRAVKDGVLERVVNEKQLPVIIGRHFTIPPISYGKLAKELGITANAAKDRQRFAGRALSNFYRDSESLQ